MTLKNTISRITLIAIEIIPFQRQFAAFLYRITL